MSKIHQMHHPKDDRDPKSNQRVNPTATETIHDLLKKFGHTGSTFRPR